MSERPLNVGCYVARAHGLAGLRAVLGSERYRVACVMTHRRKARFEDEARAERPDFADYRALTEAYGVPLWTVDSRRARDGLATRLAPLGLDLLLSISWRMLITAEELATARLGGVNLHRGRLPECAGAFPIAQALERGDSEVVITAHVITSEIDGGPVLATGSHPITERPGETSEAQVERLKGEITPLFGPLALRALGELEAQRRAGDQNSCC